MRSQQNLKLAKWMLAVLCVSLFGLASAADAAGIRHPIERRQHPGRGFFETNNSQKARTTQQPTAWTQDWLRSQRAVSPSSQSGQKSWRWQRSSRAALHHPAPRSR